MPDGGVAGSWARIVAVLEAHAPASARHINGPADAGTLDRLRSEIAVPLPPDLAEWLSLADGAEQSTEVIPEFTPLGAEGIIAETRMRNQAHGDSTGASTTVRHPAGTEGGGLPGDHWLLIPVGRDDDGSSLVIDLRDGDLHGCLMKWWGRQFRVVSRWPGIAVMLAEIAGALEHGRPEGREPTTEEIAHCTRTGHLAVFTASGTLAWHDYGAEQAKIRDFEIMAWARSQGYPIVRGRIPHSVVQAWERREER